MSFVQDVGRVVHNTRGSNRSSRKAHLEVGERH